MNDAHAWGRDLAEVVKRFVATDDFVKRFAAVTVVVDGSFLALMGKLGSQVALMPKSTAVAQLALGQGKNAILLCLADLDQEFRATVAATTRLPIFDLWRDWVLPRSATSGRRSKAAGEPKVTYSILTQPRTASTFLSQELEEIGLGRPREHIRGFIGTIAARGLADLPTWRHWWRETTLNSQVNSIFATKVIYQQYARFAEALGVEGAGLAREIIGDRVIRIERDIVDIAVSDYVAHAVGMWHLWSDGDRQKYEEAARALVIDDDELVKRYSKFKRQEVEISRLIERLDRPKLAVTFADLTQQTTAVLSDIAKFLGVTTASEVSSKLQRAEGVGDKVSEARGGAGETS